MSQRWSISVTNCPLGYFVFSPVVVFRAKQWNVTLNTWTVGPVFSCYHKKTQTNNWLCWGLGIDLKHNQISGNCIQVQTSFFLFFFFLLFITILLKSKNCWQLRIVLTMAFVIVVTTSYLNFSNSGALICFFFWCSLPISVYNIICHFPAMAMAAPDPASWELTTVWSGIRCFP